MDREQILAKQLGPELDFWVAERIMGLEVKEAMEPDYFMHGIAKLAKVPKQERNKIPSIKIYRANGKVIKMYSTNISAACEVEKKIKELGREDLYVKELLNLLGYRLNVLDYADIFNLMCTTPEQRCKAALLAVICK